MSGRRLVAQFPNCRGGPVSSFSRRDFTRLLALSGLSGSAALLPGTRLTAADVGIDFEDLEFSPPPQAPPQPDEKYWQQVRARFLLPRDVIFFNAANLCPASLPAI